MGILLWLILFWSFGIFIFALSFYLAFYLIRNRKINAAIIEKVGIRMLVYTFSLFPFVFAPMSTYAIESKTLLLFYLFCSILWLIYVISNIGIMRIKNWGRITAIYSTTGLVALLFFRWLWLTGDTNRTAFYLYLLFPLLPFFFLFLFLIHPKTKKQFIKDVA